MGGNEALLLSVTDRSELPSEPEKDEHAALRAMPFYSKRRQLLAGSFVVLFLRYGVATFLSSFFTQVATGMGISGTYNGLIFAGYPFGMSLTSIVAPALIQRVGTRTSVVFGLVCTGVFNLLFGLTPDFTGEGLTASDSNKWLFLLVYFMNGMTGALAETACLVMIARYYQDHIGVVMSAVGTVSGVGCMLGPMVGGGFYSLVDDPRWAFRTPFFACAVLPLLLLPAVRWFMPQEYVKEEGAKSAAPSTILSLSVVLGLISTALSGTIVATLDPTLSYRLSAAPFFFSPSLVSFFFTYSSIVYVAISIPVGRIVDRYAGNSRVFKLTTSFGFVVLATTFALLSPLQPKTFGIEGSTLDTSLNAIPYVATAMACKGVGSAFSNNAVYPDLIIGLNPTDAVLQATVSGLWNAAYAVGWAAGPLVGGVLYETFKVSELCLSKGGGHCDQTPTCSCDWKANNGFDGFGSIAAVISLLYAIVLFCAALLSAKSPQNKVSPDGRAIKPIAPADQGAATGVATPNALSPTSLTPTSLSGPLPAIAIGQAICRITPPTTSPRLSPSGSCRSSMSR